MTFRRKATESLYLRLLAVDETFLCHFCYSPVHRRPIKFVLYNGHCCINGDRTESGSLRSQDQAARSKSLLTKRTSPVTPGSNRMHWRLRIILITSKPLMVAHRLEPECRSAQPLDRPVIGLDTVVEVFRLTVLASASFVPGRADEQCAHVDRAMFAVLDRTIARPASSAQWRHAAGRTPHTPPAELTPMSRI
jgi:hypothetical protein